MNFLQKILLYQGGKVRYGTAGTTTQTTLASQGGLLINIDSATGDIPQTGSTWIEDEKYGFFTTVVAGTTSAEFDTAVTRTGTKTLKLSTTNATGRLNCFNTAGATVAELSKNGIPLKASTKYKLSCWVKTNNVFTNSADIAITTYSVTAGLLTSTFSNKLTGTNDWTLCTVTFTSDATAVYGRVLWQNGAAGNISDAWFDINSMTLEEVVEPVANSLTSSSPSLVSFTAVGSTDNIDQSLDTGGAAAFTYVPLVAISETATNRQTFVPTKSKVTRIGVWVVAKGTGNWTLTVHDASNVAQATITIANASLTNGAFNYFNVPCNETALASYHFHVTSTVLDGNLKSGVTLDMEGASYIQNYYKPTTNFKASQNNSTVSISADEDGFLDGSVINLTTGGYNFTSTDSTIKNIVYSSTQKFWVDGQTYLYCISVANGISNNTIVIKNTFPTTVTGFDLSLSMQRIKLEYSTDNASWTTLEDYTGTITTKTYSVTGLSTSVIYLRANKATAMTDNCFFKTIVLTANFTPTYSVLKNYPTNKDIIKQYATTLSGATTSATYRATKWGFPAIEYSATEYQFLDVDTTATGSTVAFSELGTSYTTLADGASLAITSTSTPNLFVKANITSNRMFISSNDYNASSDKDGSNKQSVVYQVIQ